jgi:hypothetical protein
MGVTQIKSRNIGDGTVDSADLKDGSVTTSKFAADATAPLALAVVSRTSDPALTDGAEWYDSTTTVKRRFSYHGGAKLRNSYLIDAITANTTTLTNTTTKTALTPGVTIPANLLTVGKTIRVKGSGHYTASGTPSLTIDLWANYPSYGLDGNTQVCGATSFGRFHFEILVTVRSVGAAGTATVGGYFVGEFAAGNTFQTAGQNLVTLDTTTALTVNAVCQWSVASVNNSVTVRQFTVEVLE